MDSELPPAFATPLPIASLARAVRHSPFLLPDIIMICIDSLLFINTS
jgi:hypothetical protein